MTCHTYVARTFQKYHQMSIEFFKSSYIISLKSLNNLVSAKWTNPSISYYLNIVELAQLYLEEYFTKLMINNELELSIWLPPIYVVI